MRYDTVVIGAGMSGIGAAIRLAQFDRRVLVLERHYLWGGLNSFYKLAGRRFDSGLHALTNFVPPRTRGAPLTRILRQLRLAYDDLALAEQSWSESAFELADETVRLRFSNDEELLRSEVARLFPSEVAGFERMLAELPGYSDLGDTQDTRSTRAMLSEFLDDALLREMLLLPVFYYGSPSEDDLDWTSFGVLFRSILLEGMARPEGGVKHLLDLLVARLKEVGGELRMRSGVQRIVVEAGEARGVVLDDGTEIECDQVISSAGWPETAALCGDALDVPERDVGQLSFIESISVLDTEPAALGHESTISFFNVGERFSYARPETPIDARSGVICCPNNYRTREPLPEGLLRITVLADPAHWESAPEEEYRAGKEAAADEAMAAATRFVPDVRPHTVFRDVFTPRTIKRFTGRLNGAVYGSPTKLGSGETGVKNLFVCGTDQGQLGIVGALLSGIGVANRHALVAS